MNGVHFRARRARRACEAGIFYIRQFNLPRWVTYFIGSSRKTVNLRKLMLWMGYIFARGGRTVHAKREFLHQTISFAQMDNLFYWFESKNSQFEIAYVVNEVHFRARRPRRTCEAGFFFADRFHLPRRFQRRIARPQGSALSTKCTQTAHFWTSNPLINY